MACKQGRDVLQRNLSVLLSGDKSLSLLCPGGRSPCRVSTLFVGCSQSVCGTLVKESARFSNGVCR